jgi:hypothetical protein
MPRTQDSQRRDGLRLLSYARVSVVREGPSFIRLARE